MQEADKNYAPPKAHVADVEQIRLPMPRQVLVAVYLLYAQVALNFAGTVVAGQKALPLNEEIGGVGGIVIWSLLPYFISRRSRIAKGILLFLILLALVTTAVSLYLHVRTTDIPRPIAWITLVMRIAAVCLLFTKPAKAWFKPISGDRR